MLFSRIAKTGLHIRHFRIDRKSRLNYCMDPRFREDDVLLYRKIHKKSNNVRCLKSSSEQRPFRRVCSFAGLVLQTFLSGSRRFARLQFWLEVYYFFARALPVWPFRAVFL